MIWEHICSVVLEWSWEPDANGIGFVLESIYEVKIIFYTPKYVSACLVQPYFRFVDVKLGVMCMFAQAMALRLLLPELLSDIWAGVRIF